MIKLNQCFYLISAFLFLPLPTTALAANFYCPASVNLNCVSTTSGIKCDLENLPSGWIAQCYPSTAFTPGMHIISLHAVHADSAPPAIPATCLYGEQNSISIYQYGLLADVSSPGAKWQVEFEQTYCHPDPGVTKECPLISA